MKNVKLAMLCMGLFVSSVGATESVALTSVEAAVPTKGAESVEINLADYDYLAVPETSNVYTIQTIDFYTYSISELETIREAALNCYYEKGDVKFYTYETTLLIDAIDTMLMPQSHYKQAPNNIIIREVQEALFNDSLSQTWEVDTRVFITEKGLVTE